VQANFAKGEKERLLGLDTPGNPTAPSPVQLTFRSQRQTRIVRTVLSSS
jgi:hypothetical protein